MKRIPDRWSDYTPCTWIPIKDERVIAFKTPLSLKFSTETPDDGGLVQSQRFTPSDLINELEKRNLHLGLVLDFTFTKRYYNPQELIDKGIIYKKIMCPGQEIPNDKDVKKVQYEVDSFLKSDKTGALVGIHCTHGLNRTGYMVCRYLIDCRGYKPEDAIKAFNESRGYPIERENYLEDLRSRTPGHGVEFIPECETLDEAIQRPRKRRESVLSGSTGEDSNQRLTKDIPPRKKGREEDDWSRRSYHNDHYSYTHSNSAEKYGASQGDWYSQGRYYPDRPRQSLFSYHNPSVYPSRQNPTDRYLGNNYDPRTHHRGYEERRDDYRDQHGYYGNNNPNPTNRYSGNNHDHRTYHSGYQERCDDYRDQRGNYHGNNNSQFRNQGGYIEDVHYDRRRNRNYEPERSHPSKFRS